MVARIVLILTATAALAGCSGGGAPPGADAAGERARVVAGFYPLAYAAERIGGDDVQVTDLTPTGAEPHDLELSARDVERVRTADVVLHLGGFQPALERAAKGAEGEVVDLLDGLGLREGDDGAADPHVWLDPLRYAALAERIGRALGAEERAAALVARLEALHAELERGLSDCARRDLVTSHAAFGYLADRYGFEQVGFSGASPEAEPGARDLERLVGAVRARGATTIFVEPLVSPRLAETVARETDARIAVLDPLEGLTRARRDEGADYFSVMRENLATLREALGCR